MHFFVTTHAVDSASLPFFPVNTVFKCSPAWNITCPLTLCVRHLSQIRWTALPPCRLIPPLAPFIKSSLCLATSCTPRYLLIIKGFTAVWVCMWVTVHMLFFWLFFSNYDEYSGLWCIPDVLRSEVCFIRTLRIPRDVLQKEILSHQSGTFFKSPRHHSGPHHHNHHHHHKIPTYSHYASCRLLSCSSFCVWVSDLWLMENLNSNFTTHQII